MRKPMVTRTMKTMKINVLCLNVQTAEPFNTEVVLPRVINDQKKLMDKVHEVVDNDEVKAVHIVDTEVVETLYGMTEEAFIQMAEVLPPRGAESEGTETESNEE